MATDSPTEIINSATPVENALFGVHPRLYADSARLAELRGLVAQAPYASLLARVRRFVDPMVARGCPSNADGDIRGVGCAMANLAMVWKMTGDRQYFDAARAFLRTTAGYETWGTDLNFGHLAHGAAVAWDWLHDELEPDERATVAVRLVHHGRVFFEEWADYDHFAAFGYTFNHASVPLCGMTALGAALFGEVPGVAPWLKMALEKARLMVDSLGSDGVSPEGQAYGQYHAEFLAKLLVLIRDVLGIDFLTTSAWWRAHGNATLAHTFPRAHWRNGEVFFMFGDADRRHWYGPDPQLRLCARLFNDGRAQWLADALHAADGVGDTAAFLNVIWHDPAVVPEPPTGLPSVQHCADQDIVIMRSDWSGDENVLALKCGPHSGHWNRRYNHNVSGGHMHPAAGAFALFAYGDMLLIESGYTQKRTAYENTLLVNGRGQTGEGGAWFEDLEFRKGKPAPRVLEVGRTGAFDVIVADATHAYDDELGVQRFVRRVLFLAPDCWVVIDEVETAALADLAILFHGRRAFEPLAEGRFVQRGERGALVVQPLALPGVRGAATMQRFEGQGHPERDVTVGLLTVSPGTSSKQATFVTFLHAYPAAAEPVARARVVPGDSGETVEIVRGDEPLALLSV